MSGGLPSIQVTCGEEALAQAFARRRAELRVMDLEGRLRAEDPSLWPGPAAEIQARLGWLSLPRQLQATWDTCRHEADRLRSLGIRRAILVGIGGSSLGAQLLCEAYAGGAAALDLAVLDSTLPGKLRDLTADWDAPGTAIIAASKSGDTLEMAAGLATLHARLAAELTSSEVAQRMVVITDPGSALDRRATLEGWSRVHGDPRVGGRFSLLSAFGLLPAALRDLRLNRALRLAEEVAAAPWHEALDLAALLAAGHDLGRDQACLQITGMPMAYGAWLEQLVAESSGKGGQGVLPVTVGQLGSRCGGRRAFAIGLHGLGGTEGLPQAPMNDQASVPAAGVSYGVAVDGDSLAAADDPAVYQRLPGREALLAACFQWELATAALGALLRQNPFDQPDVEAAKVAARACLKDQPSDLAPPSSTPWPEAAALDLALAGADYVALLAYLPERPDTDGAISALAAVLGERYGCSCVAAYGPRYLHATGQLFKGDAGRGAFLILDGSGLEPDLGLPEAAGIPAGASFGRIAAAQAAGDAAALAAAGRRVLLVRLAPDWRSGGAAWQASLQS